MSTFLFDTQHNGQKSYDSREPITPYPAALQQHHSFQRYALHFCSITLRKQLCTQQPADCLGCHANPQLKTITAGFPQSSAELLHKQHIVFCTT